MKSPNYRYSIITVLITLTVLVFATVANVQADVIVCFPMDTNPGWSTQGQWSFGVPLGSGSHCYDPISGHTGTNVYGYNLSGDYTNSMPEYYLTTGPVDCSAYEDVTLTFWRWLGVESASFDHAKVEVSNNGSTWVIVWEHTGSSLCDGAWIECIYDISAIADRQPTVYIRWAMGPTDSSVTYPGWNIDDVCLLGDPIDVLNITPTEGFLSSGNEGGPFSPNSKTYTLTNDSPNTLDWTAAATEPWLDVTPGSGTLTGGASTTVDVCINANASALPGGRYTNTVTFTNLTSGVDQVRNVDLLIGTIASIPFVEGFEDGPILDPWWEVTGTNEYRTEVTTSFEPHGGLYHLTMDDTIDSSQYSRNELTLTINLDNYENVLLTFWSRDFGDEPHGPPPIPFTGGYDFDGVAISEDGYYWYEVQDLRNLSSTYMQLTVDLDAAIAAYGLTYNSTFKIRFNQYDNYPISTDGIAIDDIEITGRFKDDLSITPDTGFISSGYEGGPFTPSSKSYTLTNIGPNSFDWTAESTVLWVNVEPNGGTLLPAESNVVEVSLNAEVNALPPGQYNDIVTFTNTTSDIVQMRDVALEVLPIPGEIEVIDTIPPLGDHNLPFGDVFVGLRRTEKVRIANTDPDYGLIITDISLGGVSGLTVPASELSIQLPGVTSDPGDSYVSYLPAGWVVLKRPGSNLVIKSGYRTLMNIIDVLMLASGDDPTIMRTALEAFPDINTVDYFDCSYFAPQLSDLIGYDVVVIMSESAFADVVQTGDVLADYVDAGGKVVQAVATFAYGGDWELEGRFVTQAGYEPFIHGDAELFSHSLGVFEQSHPIMDGVTTLTDEYPVSVALELGVEWVADWDNGSALVATQGQSVVGINIFVFDRGDFTGDVPLLFHNAIVWLLEGTVRGFELIGCPDLPVTIPPLGSITFDVVFEPLEEREYESEVVIISNDADEPDVVVLLSGTGILEYLEITPEEEFEFSGHPGGPFIPSNTSYQLTNTGPVNVDWNADANVPWLDVSPSSGTLNPCESATVTIMPSAQAREMNEGYYCGDLIVTDITTTVELRRRVCLNVHTDPKIWVTPQSFNVTVPQGWSQNETLTIGNGGDTDLNFSLSSREIDYLPPAKTTVTEIKTGDDMIVLECEFNEPAVYKDNDYDWVRIEGLQQYQRVGAPIIPVRPVEVLVPFGKKVVTARTIPLDTYDLPGSYRLPPAQKPYPLSYRGTMQPTEPNLAIYGQAKPWPGINYEQVTIQSKRGYQVLTANLFPLQYVPTTGKISYASKLRLEIELADSISANIVRPSTRTTSALRTMVDNPDVLRTYPVKEKSVQKLGDPEALPSGGPYQYVIITSGALEAAPAPWNFQALRDAKIACGMTATVVTTEWIYATYDGTRPSGGTDNQTKIRNFLIDAYHNWGTEYVLLGGNANIIPARMFLVDSLVGDIDEMPVDMYYGCVEPQECTFDYDADGFYGEPTDGVGGSDVDLLAEIYVGRATVENATELENFVRKTLAYDLTQNEYLSRIAMLGEYLGFGGVSEYAKDSKEQIRLGGTYDGYSTCGFEDHNQINFFDFNTVDCLPDATTCCWPLYDKDRTWNISDLLCLMNGGIHAFNHLGHTNYDYCMKLDIYDLSSLTNTDYFFVYSQGCYPGAFDISDCFAEVITSMEHGAFAVIMNARYGYGMGYSTDGPSQRFDRQFWDAPLGEGILEIGRANQDSKEDNLWDINGGCIRWCYYELNLFGDPAQKFRFAETCDWIEFEPHTGTVPADQAVDVNVVFIGEKPGGTYHGEISLNSNDPYAPQIIIPVTMTIEPLDYFTELFTNEYPFNTNDPNRNDMAYKTLTFIPDGPFNYYKLCTNEAAVFPVNPNGGTALSLNDDDYIPINLGGEQIDFYGTNYEILYIGSNGYITFISGDTFYLESFEEHFNLPRISALFDDLNPQAGGTISYKLLNDRFAVTFENVPEYSLSSTNSFQIEIFFNGTIRITLLGIAADDGLVGLSEGYGLPSYFMESDLSEYCLVADLDSDCDTDFADYALLVSYWEFLGCKVQNDWCFGTDINKDGRTNFQDLAQFTEHWLE